VPRAEELWQRALACSQRALDTGALVPLATELVAWPGLAPFLMRRLVSHTPKHLRAGGPKPNPFLPWDPRLEVSRLGDSHVVLLNKFPVEPGHVLVISQQWQPQSGWLSQQDWRAVAEVDGDTGGLWFFNSCAAAGASQPHRHLQLLPRRQGEDSCPLAPLIHAQLRGGLAWPWRYALSPRSQSGATADELGHLYGQHAGRLGLGDPRHDPQPRHPYNLLFNDHWLLTVRREREHCAGFSLNALGFAGYLLATDGSDLDWLRREGPWQLLRAVAAPAP
jgi:sulfate adenylyltransferase (ADP) / ATP adenylyltransferase